jgi:ArsR family transcriptional regulator
LLNILFLVFAVLMHLSDTRQPRFDVLLSMVWGGCKNRFDKLSLIAAPIFTISRLSNMQAKKSKSLNNAQIAEAARLFTLLSEPARLRLLSILMGEPLTVTELVHATGLKQGNVSKHLAMLLEARLVAKEKEGNFARYSIADPCVTELCNLVCHRMAQEAKRRLSALSASHSVGNR